jgi:hypothetical protein
MINRVYISHLNPLNFVEMGAETLPQYNFRHMDDFMLHDRLNQWQYGEYYQPFQNNDTISLQFQNNIGQMQVNVIDCKGYVIPGFSFLLTQVAQNKLDTDYFIYEGNIALEDLEPGKYYVTVNIGSSPVKKVLISNPIEVLETHVNSLLIQYSHKPYKENFIFETGMIPEIRFEGLLKLNPPTSKDTLFEDQILDMIMIQSKPYRVWTLYVFAVADFMIDKLGRIFGCKDLKIDGKYFSKNGESAKWEETAINIENGTMIAYKIELRESLTRNSKVYSTTEDINEELIIVLNVDSKGFADTSSNASSNNMRILDVE